MQHDEKNFIIGRSKASKVALSPVLALKQSSKVCFQPSHPKQDSHSRDDHKLMGSMVQNEMISTLVLMLTTYFRKWIRFHRLDAKFPSKIDGNSQIKIGYEQLLPGKQET